MLVDLHVHIVYKPSIRSRLIKIQLFPQHSPSSDNKPISDGINPMISFRPVFIETKFVRRPISGPKVPVI